MDEAQNKRGQVGTFEAPTLAAERNAGLCHEAGAGRLGAEFRALAAKSSGVQDEIDTDHAPQYRVQIPVGSIRKSTIFRTGIGNGAQPHVAARVVGDENSYMEPPRQAYPRAVHGSDGAGIRFRIVRDDEPGREDGAAILDQYEAARIGMAAPAQLRFNTASVRDLLRASGVRDPRDLQAAHIEAWLAGLARRGDSPHTRRNRLGGAGAVMSWLKKGHQIKHNPAREVDAPPVEDSPHIYLSESQREQALCIAAAAGIECEVTVALYAGLRMAELQRLRWRDVDLEGKAIMVVGAKGRNGTRKWRRVWLHSRAIAALHRQWQKTGAFEWVFPGGRRREDGAPGGGTWDRNRPRGRESWLSLLRPLQDAIPVFGRVPMGSTGRGWHTLRHTYASLGLQHGVDMKKISVWLGHSSIVTTERHYAWLAERYDPDCEKL